MNPLSIIDDFLGATTRRRGRVAFGVTALLTAVRVFRRFTRPSTKQALSFEVKPGEVYEIRGTRRDQ